MPQTRERLSYPQTVFDLAARDSQLGALTPLELPLPSPSEAKKPTFQEVIEAVTLTYADRAALGCRAYDIGSDPETGRPARNFLPEFRTISYRELRDRIRRLAAAWQDHPQHHVDPGDFVCILGFASIDYVTVDLACAYAQAVSVPLQATLGGDLTNVFANTAPVCVAATMDDIVTAAELALAQPSIRSVVAFDFDAAVDSDCAQLKAASDVLANGKSRAELVKLDDLVADRTADSWRPLPPSPEGAERMALLVHSSGSTGQPKGAIYPEWLAMRTFAAGQPKVPIVSMAFAPLNHRMGQGLIANTLSRGGTAYFTCKPDLSQLFEDIRLVRPTELNLIPRVMEIIYRHYLAEVIRRSGGSDPTDDVRADVMAEMRAGFLGNRLCALSMGSAPATPEVKQFISDCFQLPLSDWYGSTEAGGVLLNGRITRPPVIDYKLRDVPELGYFASDKPFPRGELCVKTATGVSGYYKQPEATAKLFDENGYFRTGDIMEERGPDELVFLDRANDVLKLSQGEFIAVGALGGVFENGCPSIQQIYIYGNSARSYLVAVVVPDMSVIETRLGPQPDDAALRALLRADMKRAADEAGLRAAEIPRDFIIEREPFSFENGLLTSVRKRRRPALKARYGAELEALYEAQERKQDEDLRTLRDDDSIGVEDKLVKALEASLGIETGGVDLSLSFAELGGDSLGATGFAMLLSEIFSVDVPVNTIMSPAGNVRTWARAIKTALKGEESNLPTYARIHGDNASRLNADNLDITAFLDADILDTLALEPPEGESRVVLLTGATGYLGRFLCLEWLERLAARGGKLICLVRAADEQAALGRLSESFASDPELEERFDTLARAHLEIMIGDVAEPGLGLDEVTRGRLAREVDHIVHCGALVNHVLPYEDLFGPNVVGTAQLVKLALTHRQKRFDFVSSVAVLNMLDPGTGRTETSPLLREVTLNNSYAEGYACSKWASEHLLVTAHVRYGLPVNIFRCGMILIDRRYTGQLNLADAFTRLLYSLVVTQAAPASFYRQANDGSRQPAHYDGLPVDFVAAAIAGIGDEPDPHPLRTFHVTNPNADAQVSLDTFVDWIEEEGYRIERDQDHDAWLERFELKLRSLPEEKRQRSVLAVLASVRQPVEPMRVVDSAQFEAAVSRLPMRQVPPLDRALLRKYLSDLRLLQLISEPAREKVEFA